jgi:hypothetical protein
MPGLIAADPEIGSLERLEVFLSSFVISPALGNRVTEENDLDTALLGFA